MLTAVTGTTLHAPEYLWLIPLLPFASCCLISLVLIPAGARRLSGWVTIAAIFGSFLLALQSFSLVHAAGEGAKLESIVTWFVVGKAHLEVGLTIDGLGAVMLILVTSVSLLVQIYSQGYMEEETARDYGRYFAFMSLFTTAMLGLVLANNFLMLYIFWELVGLCSYLLIGFWFRRPSAASAAKKAFVVTRLGDLGFLVGIILTYLMTGSLTFAGAEAKMATLGAGTVTAIALLLFCGAIGKSAQFPLHVWLPDAMEGPTPVSALIHAATMVAAGVYMVARLFPIFSKSPDAMFTVAAIGGFTALLSAGLGIVVFDIKRVMAYSTISQLGYMMLGLGSGSVVAGIFHLFNHGFFKALLFLTAGSAHHATHTFDMRYMGGLRRYMPITYTTIVIASLSLSGIFPLSGFWSKDEIIAQALHRGGMYQVLYYLALLVAFMTAFYSFRMIFMAFHGQYRGGAEAEAGHASAHGSAEAAHGEHHLHESPLVMTVPLMILAVLSIVTGFFNLNGDFAVFLGGHPEPVNLTVAIISSGVAVAGILLAVVVYQLRWISAQAVAARLGLVYRWVYNKYLFDVLYENIIAAGLIVGIGKVLDWFDIVIVDGIADGVAKVIRGAGGVLRRVETGQLQTYALAIFAGAVIIVAYLALGPK